MPFRDQKETENSLKDTEGVVREIGEKTQKPKEKNISIRKI